MLPHLRQPSENYALALKDDGALHRVIVNVPSVRAANETAAYSES